LLASEQVFAQDYWLLTSERFTECETMSKKQDRLNERLKAARKAEQKKNRAARNNATKAKQLKPKPGKLPDKRVMDAIADSLHDAVTSVFDELENAGANMQAATANATMKGRCLYYAAAGQYVAAEFVGREYWVQVGSLGVMTDDQNMVKIDAANGGVEARRFHMWLGSDDGRFVEHVDFTSRFFKDWARAVGANWERDDLPTYLWGKTTDIRQQHGVYYQTEISQEPDADRQIKTNQDTIDRIVERAIAIARKRLLG
jgi:hypothetical protein